MGNLRRALVGVAMAGGFLVAGCATPGDIETLRNGLLQQMAQTSKAQQDQTQLLQERLGKMEANLKLLDERSKALEQRVEQVAKIPASLESDVAAVRGYARDVEKKITDLRELVARQLDNQNAHITQVKTAYGNVLQEQVTMVETMTKTLDAALAELKVTIDKSLGELKKALPGSESVIPPAPPLPGNLEGPPAPPAPK